MYQEHLVSVVIPAHNEELLIERVVGGLPEFVDHIIVVDDFSTDKTAEKLVGLKKVYGDRLIVIRHSTNLGVGGAIVTGYEKSLELAAEKHLVAVMAGDAQMDPEDLPKLLAPCATSLVDYAKGNRLITGQAWKIIPRTRYLGNAVLSLLTKIASGYWHVADSQTGYTVIRAEALAVLQLRRLYPRYGFPNHLLVELNNYDFRVRDVPIKPVYNVGEVSGIRLHKVIPTISWLLFRCYFWRMKEKYIIRDFHPLVFFLTFGLFLTLGGTAFGAYLAYLRLFSGPITAVAVIFDAFCLIIGIQSILFALWMDMERNKDLK
ncbi:MAG: glycosyltransferase family 2 protein [Vicinamibacteria bacterium]